MTSIIKADNGAVSGITGITQTADSTGTLELQATSGLVTLANVTGALAVPTGTTAQRPSTLAAGMMRYNTTTNSTEIYSGIAWVAVTSQTYSVDFLVIGGGGGGSIASGNGGGGGGAGGYRTSVGTSGGGGSAESVVTVTGGTAYSITVGAGGASATSGASSIFSSVTSLGGGTDATGGAVGSLTEAMMGVTKAIHSHDMYAYSDALDSLIVDVETIAASAAKMANRED